MNLWVLLNSLKNVDSVVYQAIDLTGFELQVLSCHLWAVVPMFIHFSKPLLCCFGFIPCICVSGTWAADVILFGFQSLGFVLWVDLVHTQIRGDPGACDRIKGSLSSTLYSLRFLLYPFSTQGPFSRSSALASSPYFRTPVCCLALWWHRPLLKDKRGKTRNLIH